MLNRFLVLRKGDATRLFGEVFEDDRFVDGHWILTNHVSAEGKYIYVTKTPTIYNVKTELSLTEFLETVLMKEKFPTEGLNYCINIIDILQANMDENKELQKFMDKLLELQKYDPKDW